MNVEDLKELQDNAVDFAKRLIKRDGDMGGLAIIVTHHGNIEKLKALDAQVEHINPKQMFKDFNDHDVAILIRPWPTAWKDMFTVLYHCIPVEKRPVLDYLLSMAKTLEFEDDYIHVCRPLMNVMNVTEKDVVRIAIEQICHATDAIAIINISTAWQGGAAACEHLEEYGSLADDPTSKEVLMVSLEAHAIERMIFVPILRAKSISKKRDGGRVTGWGTADEVSSDQSLGNRWEGRFHGLLKPLKSQETA